MPSAALSLAAVLAVDLRAQAARGRRLAAGGLDRRSASSPARCSCAASAGSTDPLIDLSLFRVPAFSAALATNLVAFFVIFGMALFTAQYAQSVLGYSPLIAGLPIGVRGARVRRRLDASPRG